MTNSVKSTVMSKNMHICKLSDVPANGIRDFVLNGGERVLIANFSENGTGISPPESLSALPKPPWKAIRSRLKTVRFMCGRPMR